MPEIHNGRQIFTLLEVATSIERTLTQRYTSAFWVKAEMNKLNHYPHSGHCYPDLIEKNNGTIVAQMRANLWRDDYERINQQFLQVLKEPLKDGINIMFLAKINFTPLYGLSLRILDIDPAYSLGALEKEKLETIEKLKKENIFHANKLLKLPVLPQRIAVISVSTSKGYADFTNVLMNNEWNYRFFIMLFPALLQGEKAVESITAQLEQIKRIKHHFDLVAIIRGGGGDVGLSCYNHYELARAIALFPLPVMTGIGHSTNETVAEMVSHTTAITPTKLAEFLIQKFHNFSVPVAEAWQTITKAAKEIIHDEKNAFTALQKEFLSATRHYLSINASLLTQNTLRLHASTTRILQVLKISLMQLPDKTGKLIKILFHRQQQEIRILHNNLQLMCRNFVASLKNQLELYQNSITLLDPIQVLKRGYSITLKNGKSLRSSTEAQPGDIIETRLASGSLISEIQNIKNDNK